MSQCRIEGSGELTGVGSFRGPKELGALLVEGGALDACIVRQYLQFALGRGLSAGEDAAVEQLERAFAGSEHSFADLIASFVESEAFARRVEPEMQ